MPNIYGDNSKYFREGINTADIEDLNYTSKIDLSSPNVIDFESANVQINGVNILTDASGLANPLVANLDGGSFSIINVQNVESVTRTENNVSGELLKKIGTNNYVAAGGGALLNGTGTNSIMIGNDAGLSAVTLSNCIFLGTNAGAYTTQNNNVFIGYDCGNSGIINNGLFNTFLGNLAGTSLTGVTTGNVGFGYKAGESITSNRNTCIGTRSDSTGENNTCIGHSAKSVNNDSVAFGKDSLTTADNQIMLGGPSIVETVPMTNGLCDLGSVSNKFKDCYLGGNLEVSSINSINPNGGLYLATDAGFTVTNTTVESNLIGAMPFVGSMSIPANTFTISSYNLNISGNFESKNQDTLTLRLYAGPLASTLLDTMVIPMAGTTGSHFEIETDFDVQIIGAAGVAQIAINKELTYQDSGLSVLKGYRICTTNNTTFDTTVLNFLNVTVQYSSASLSNSIQATRAVLKKVY